MLQIHWWIILKLYLMFCKGGKCALLVGVWWKVEGSPPNPSDLYIWVPKIPDYSAQTLWCYFFLTMQHSRFHTSLRFLSPLVLHSGWRVAGEPVLAILGPGSGCTLHKLQVHRRTNTITHSHLTWGAWLWTGPRRDWEIVQTPHGEALAGTKPAPFHCHAKVVSPVNYLQDQGPTVIPPQVKH